MTIYYVDPVNGNDANTGLGFWGLAYTGGSGSQPVAAATATGASSGATAKIISVGGTWGASGTLYLYGKSGAFTNGETINFTGGGSCANAQGTPYDAVYASFKTIHKTFAAGDTVNVAKCAEPAQSGTGVFTQGSLSVTGISGWTPAQYDIIRVGDNQVYGVQGFGSGTITLYRPYRGTSGTKTINKLTLFSLATNNDLLTTGSGVLGNMINLQGGINTATLAQDGFSIWTGAYHGLQFPAGGFYNVSRIGGYYVLSGMFAYQVFNDCTFTDCYAQRAYNGPAIGLWFGCTSTNFMQENLSSGMTAFDSIFYSFDSGGASAADNLIVVAMNNCTFYSPKLPTYNSKNCVKVFGTMIDVVFVDPIVDELNNGGYAFGFNGFASKIVFRNPAMGAATLFVSNSGGAIGTNFGDVEFSNINGDPTRHSKYIMSGEASGYTGALNYDSTVYKTSTPSARVNLQQSLCQYIKRFEIPCDANVAKTISVYVMLNSNPIATFTINAAGSGYAVGDFFSVTQSGGYGAIFKVLTLSGSGVATVLLVSGGGNFSVASALATVALTGAGSGCKINIVSVAAGYGSVTLPTMRLRWTTGTTGALVSNVYDVVATSTPDAWQQLSHQVSPTVKGTIIVEMIFQSLGAGAIGWFDDFGVV